ncbi:RNA polymerase sigma factor SigZ [Paenibacillus sambharensis]|uniref:RNA polymerase sigma factor SigZ n=1 Tax=Paenibacillus sambharensis TaxID=1803190 RepID=A0A2W1LSA3_9BACL|nr:RNA polymerase sigma factor SigZ [Paenibacillus sambharensis]PZD97364.1 RNA polymerase sigma factor SigZ [Paenibacillus sambharensis]
MLNIEEVWTSFHSPLHKFIVGKTGNRAAADDILQDVFVKILKRLDTLQEEEKLRAWMYQITRHAIVDYYRKEKRMEELPEQLSEQLEQEEHNLNQEFSACLMPFLDELPAKYREALILTELNGCSQKDVSDMLNISYSGAKSRVQRGRQKLKEILEACCHFEHDRYGNILDIVPRQAPVCEEENTCSCSG